MAKLKETTDELEAEKQKGIMQGHQIGFLKEVNESFQAEFQKLKRKVEFYEGPGPIREDQRTCGEFKKDLDKATDEISLLKGQIYKYKEENRVGLSKGHENAQLSVTVQNLKGDCRRLTEQRDELKKFKDDYQHNLQRKVEKIAELEKEVSSMTIENRQLSNKQLEEYYSFTNKIEYQDGLLKTSASNDEKKNKEIHLLKLEK